MSHHTGLQEAGFRTPSVFLQEDNGVREKCKWKSLSQADKKLLSRMLSERAAQTLNLLPYAFKKLKLDGLH